MPSTAAVCRLATDIPIELGAPGGRWHVTTTPDGPATVHLHAEVGAIVVEAWGPGREWALDRANEIAGLDDDPTGFDPRPHPLVARLARERPGMRLGRTSRILDILVPTVLAQLVTTREATRAWRGLVRVYGRPAPGPEGVVPPYLRVPPDAAVLAPLGYAAFHRFGVERRRAETVLRVCRDADRLEALVADGASLDEVDRRLRHVAGIGPWTSAHVRATAFGDPDAVPVGDYHLPGAVGWALAGERDADDDRMLELLAPFAGHRARVVRLLIRGGPRRPRRGPRMPVKEWRTW